MLSNSMEIGVWALLALVTVFLGLILSIRKKNLVLKERNKLLSEELTETKIENASLIASLKSAEAMENRFETIALKVLEGNQSQFESRSVGKVEGILKPFQKDMKDFKEKVEGFNRDNRDNYVDLSRQLKYLREVNLTLNEQALDLTKALKGDSKIRGDWGEERLDRLLEESGFKEGQDYFKQFSYVDGDGGMKRPDCVIKLPKNRNVVVDSKVSLVDYAKYQNADNNSDGERHLKSHINSLKAHVKSLSRKNYGELGASLDQVLMFVPIEPALMLALEKAPELEQEALASNIVLTSSSTLLWALKIISFLWTQERQTKNVLEIAEAGGKVHDQAILVAEAVETTGAHIEKARESFEKTKLRLANGRGNLISQIANLRKLGAKTKRQIPQEYHDGLTNSDSTSVTESKGKQIEKDN